MQNIIIQRLTGDIDLDDMLEEWIGETLAVVDEPLNVVTATNTYPSFKRVADWSSASGIIDLLVIVERDGRALGTADLRSVIGYSDGATLTIRPEQVKSMERSRDAGLALRKAPTAALKVAAGEALEAKRQTREATPDRVS